MLFAYCLRLYPLLVNTRVWFFSFREHYAYEKSVFITHKIPPQSKSRNLSPGFIGSKPDRCVPDWQYNAADSGSNASVSCGPGIPALFQKQQNIHKIIQQKNMNQIPSNNLKQNSCICGVVGGCCLTSN